MTTILIVEDDKETQFLMYTRLNSYFNIICASDEIEALNIVYENHIDLIVTDIMFPNINAYELIKRLRSERINIPILIVTEKKSFEDKRKAYLSGADDYMTKPLNYDELFLRINALLRRSRIEIEKKIVFGSVTIDASTYSVAWGSESIVLSQKEFELLYIMLSYPSIIFTQNQLLDYTCSFDSDSTGDTIMMHIKRLKNNLKDCTEFEIITVKGLGYKAEIKKVVSNGKI